MLQDDCRGFYLQLALLVEVQDAFFEVVHLAEHQGFVEHGVVTPQEGHSLLLQDFLSLEIWKYKKKRKLKCKNPTYVTF